MSELTTHYLKFSLAQVHPQGCVSSPELFMLYTKDCTHSHPDNFILKFLDDTTACCTRYISLFCDAVWISSHYKHRNGVGPYAWIIMVVLCWYLFFCVQGCVFLGIYMFFGLGLHADNVSKLCHIGIMCVCRLGLVVFVCVTLRLCIVIHPLLILYAMQAAL